MSSQVVKPFATLVLGFLIGISAAEIYHMETQSSAGELCANAQGGVQVQRWIAEN